MYAAYAVRHKGRSHCAAYLYGGTMNNYREEAITLMTEHSIKPSYQRIQVLSYLLCNHTHPTADIIYKALSDNIPAISRATVYNTLRLFASKGIVSTFSTDNIEMRYDILTESHGHFVCTKCKKIYNFPYTYQNKYMGLDEFQIEEEEITLRGTCSSCSS